MTIAPTLSLDEAAGQVWEVVVVGAGPAGALAARELARRGTKVLLVDKASFPRWKVCGCCLNGRALAVLKAAGLGDLVQSLAAVPLQQTWLASRGRRALVPLPAGMALSREAFDAALVTAAVAAGAAFLPRTRATLGRTETHLRTVMLRQDAHQVEGTAQVVLAADGLGGRFGEPESKEAPPGRDSRLGAGTIAENSPPFYCPGTIFMACGSGGYVGLVRLEDGRLDVAAAFDPTMVKRARLGEAAAAILREAGLPPVPGLTDLPWRGTPRLTWRAPRLAAHRLFVLGDAASYVEPFTGEGIAWALAAGTAVAPLAVRAARQWQPGLAREWSAAYYQTVVSRQMACRVMAAVLRRPALTATLIGILSWAPALATPLLRRFNQLALE